MILFFPWLGTSSLFADLYRGSPRRISRVWAWIYTAAYQGTGFNASPSLTSLECMNLPPPLHCTDIKHIILLWLNTSGIKFLQWLTPFCWSWAGNVHSGKQKGKKGGKKEEDQARNWRMIIFTSISSFMLDMINFSFSGANSNICSISASQTCWQV